MKTSEINQRANDSFRLFRQFNRESILIILVSICVIIVIGTHIRINTVVDDMADIKSGYEVNIRTMVESNTELKKEVRLLEYKMDRYESSLHVRGDK